MGNFRKGGPGMDERLKNERRKLASVREKVLLMVQILDLLAAAGYVLFPADLVPDLLGLLGYADDLLAAAIGITIFLKAAGARKKAGKEREALPGPGADEGDSE
jgi:uncharacterized membrane protein YkvA (DUF1232 family)